jgi:hypothetical protein
MILPPIPGASTFAKETISIRDDLEAGEVEKEKLKAQRKLNLK